MMSVLSVEQLDHLCMLTALELDEEEKQLLLPQLDQILAFVGQLDQAILDEKEWDERGEQSPVVGLGSKQSNFLGSFLENMTHHVVDYMPILSAGLKK